MTHPKADILGRLLVIQQVMDLLPDLPRMADFLRMAFFDVPGISACQVRFTDAVGDSAGSVISGNAIPGAVHMAINTPRAAFGDICLEIADWKIFRAYEPFLGNIAQMVATILENRQNATRLSETNAKLNRLVDELEIRVEERTRDILQTQEALAASEERWKFALEGSGDGVWDWNPVTDAALFSKRWEEMIGYAEHEFPATGAAWVEHLHPDDRDRVLLVIREYFAGNRPAYVVEFRMRCRDGSWKWMLARAMIVKRDANGNPLRMIGTHTDITERKRTEEALQKENDKNIAFLRNASDGIHILDAGGHVIEVSDSFCAMLGYRREEMIGMHVCAWDAKFSPSELAQLIGQQFARKKRTQFETRHRRKDGSIFDVEISNCPFELDGKPVLFNALRDITGRKMAEAELRIAATAFESQEGMMITDADSVILRVNRAFSDITGYAAEDVVGNKPRILSSGRHDASFYAAMWHDINSTGNWNGEIWNRRKNGEIYPEHLSITAVRNVNGVVMNYLATLVDITLRKKSEEEIKYLAFYDHLTYLPNRRLLLDRLQQAMASSVRSGKLGALLFIDLDNFKILNDTLGHDVGDLMLQQVAQRLTSCVREGDTVSRLGGDEFVLMLEDLSEHARDAAAQTEAVGGKVLSTLSRPYRIAAHEFHGTASAGVILFDGHEQGVEELLKQADIAMYQAKQSGRNRMRFFDPEMQEAINARAALESELRKALENRQFQLYYQIQRDAGCTALGAEALIRWQHPQRGLISPAQFIPLAEETGLILPIGKWVLDTACAQLKAWEQHALTRDLVLAVNVSARQFHQPDFVSRVQAIVQQHAVNPERLKLELTESLLLEDINDTINTMKSLKEVGIQFSLDDFGTGYSSLQYLKLLPLDQLKIDQSFVRDRGGSA